MYRKIGEHIVKFGTLDMARVTITDGVVTVSTDLSVRTPNAEFEAIFHGMEELEVLTDVSGLAVKIGPLEHEDGETPLSIAKGKKLRELAAERYKAEVAGIMVNGMKVRTDRESQSMITGAALAAVDDPTYTCRWKTEDGFVKLNAEQIKIIAKAVRANVQACFDKEEALGRQVEAAETVQAVEAIRWS